MKNTKISLNTNAVGTLFSGTYGTWWDSSDNPDSDEYFTMQDIFEVYNDKDNDIADRLKEVVPGIKGITFTSHYSPREYNFQTDSLDFDLEVAKGFGKALTAKMDIERDNFHTFLLENYTSHDGFFSHTPNTFDEWVNEISTHGDEYEQAIGAALTFLLLEGSQGSFDDSIEGDVYEYANGNGYATGVYETE